MLGTSAGRFSTAMKMLPGKTQEFGQKKGTGLRNGVVEGQVLVSDGLDNLKVNKWEFL